MRHRTHLIQLAIALAIALGIGAPTALGRPADAAGPPPVRFQTGTRPAIHVPAPRGFDWQASAIGAVAGIALSVTAVGGGVVVVGRRRGRRLATRRVRS